VYTGVQMNNLTSRLNEILPKLTSENLLSGRGLGNEIAFYIFDYPPEEEIEVRKHVQFLLKQIPKQRPGTKVSHVNLFDMVTGYLQDRKKLDKCFKMQLSKGDAALKDVLKAPLQETKISKIFAEAAQPHEHDLVLVSGVGSVFPLLRSHTLLNNLHPVMGKTPLVMFFPGKYDGQTLKIFGKLSDNNYYRAFKLVP